MFYITNIKVKVPSEKIGEKKCGVHPFYKDTFKIVNGGIIYKEAIKLPIAFEQNEEFLLPILSNVISDNKDNICYFYDVRSSEEYGKVATEYSLIKKLNMPYIVPLCIKGALEWVQAFKIADLYMDRESALITFNQLISEYDKRNGVKGDAVAAMLFTDTLPKTKSDIFKFQTAQIFSSWKEVIKFLNEIDDYILICKGMFNCKDIPLEKIYKRKKYKDVDFGCVDVFVTLDEYIKEYILQKKTIVLFEENNKKKGIIKIEKI